MAPIDPNRLRSRRQFILGPRPLEEFAHWRTTFVGPHLVLQVHEDLPLVEVEHDGLRLTLLGYVLDPMAPEHDDRTILRELAERCPDARHAPRSATELGGRWVMIADDGTDLILFHDPCGLRQVYHSTWDATETWCASQPARIAQAMRSAVGPRQKDFLESPYVRESREPWFPSPATPWQEVRHLTPNHCLDLRTRTVSRYWPHRPLSHLEPEEGAHLAAQLLRESVRAAARRFPLAVALTAGVDSRTMLAATRGTEDVWYYTLQWDGLDRSSGDLVIPRKVLRGVRQKHHVIECPTTMSAGFEELYRSNSTLPSASAGAIAEGLLAGFPQGRVQVPGHCSEIVRDTFGVTHRPQADAEALADLMGMRGNPFAIDHFDVWLDQVRPVTARTGFREWDLFFMEQEYGVWAAHGQTQWDLVHERFTPFNQRGILTTLMGVDPAHRQPPDYVANRRIIEILWPELLSEPFNPTHTSVSARSRALCRKVREHGVRGTISKGMRRLMPR